MCINIRFHENLSVLKLLHADHSQVDRHDATVRLIPIIFHFKYTKIEYRAL